jgi:hypothetical protein
VLVDAAIYAYFWFGLLGEQKIVLQLPTTGAFGSGQ